MVDHSNGFITQLRQVRGFLIIALSLLALPVWAQSPEPTGARESFIELSADKAELYVQEQLLLTVQLYFTSELIEGELSEPVSNNAMIEALGPQQEYSRVRGNQRYRMIERRYAVYPQNPGQLSLAPITFDGRFRSADGRPRRVTNSERLFDLPVKDIPAQFSGDVWLPATEITLEESGLPEDNRVASGENLTRQLTLRANGLPAATLPPFPALAAAGLRSYPEPARRAGDINDEGLTSVLQQTSALVPVQAGELQLPELKVPWWDTRSDSQKVATIPARTLIVSASAGIADPISENPAPAIGTGSEAKNNIEQVDSAQDRAISGSGFWPWLALLLGIGWGLTALVFWRTQRKPHADNGKTKTSTDNDDSAVYKELLAAAGRNSADTPRLLLRWMNLQYPEKHFHSSRQISEFCGSPQLADALSKLEHQRYSTQSEAQRPIAAPNPELQQAIRQLRRKSTGRAAQQGGLQPLYPPAIDACAP